MGDMVQKMIAEQYVTFNIAAGLKTPKTARKSDRSRLRRLTLGEYRRAWIALDERERLAFDLVTFCGLRESEVYGLKNGDLYEHGAIRVERSWYRGDINPKTDRPRNVGVGAEIFDRLTAWIATLPERSGEGWVFPSERIVTPLLPDNVLRRCVYPRLEPMELDWINFAVLRRTHSTLHQVRRTDPKDHCRSAGPRAGRPPWGLRGIFHDSKTRGGIGIVGGFQSLHAGSSNSMALFSGQISRLLSIGAFQNLPY